MRNLYCFFHGLRRKENISIEIRRPMCWFAIGVVFLFAGLFMGRNYEEIPNLKEKQTVYLEGNIVSKEYKTSSYESHWQLLLNEVKIIFDTTEENEYKGIEAIQGSQEKIMKDSKENPGRDGKEESENSIGSKRIILEGKYLCQLNKNEEKLRIGQRVLLLTEFEPWEEVTNPGQFDLKKWYCSQGILGQFRKGRVLKQDVKYSVLRESMWQLRIWLYERLQQELGDKDGSLIGAMLLGEKSGLEEESKSFYQRNGISHVLAISGLHLTLLGMGLFAFLKHIFGNNNIVVVICIIVMLLYCVFTGNSISTIRATIMFIISFLAQVLGRSYDSLSALGLSAILQLFVNPYALNNSSFLLSFLAVVGVTFISPRLQEVLGAKKKLTKSLCVSLSASLVTLPVLLRDYGIYPWYSTILNLFIVPIMSVLLGLSILLVSLLLFSKGIVCFLKIKTGVIVMEALKTLVIYGIKTLLNYMEVCCKVFEKLPFRDSYLGSPAVWQILIYATLLFCVVGNVCKHSFFCKKMILLSAVMLLTARTEFGAEIVMLDVGQGDSIVIRNCNGNIYLADCGSSSVSKVGKYRLLPFLKQKGYGRIQGIFISHFDQDHMNGILELLQMAKEERIRIVQLFLPESVYKIENDSKKLEELLELAGKNRVKVVFLKRGDRFIDGKMQFFCLHPGTEKEGKMEQDRNNGSLVLFLKYKKNKFLLTGDVEKEGEKEILQYIDSIGLSVKPVVLKVAHHGSNGSSSEALLKVINPKLSLISSGRNNRYGHPHEETIERLEKAGSKIMNTIESGAITLKLGKEIKVYGFRK